jgi:hypothetical protein
LLVTSGLVQCSDGFIDLVALHTRAGLESISGRQLRSCLRLGLKQFAQENVTICQCFLRNECIAAVVLQRVPERRCFGGTLGGMEVACCLNDLAELFVCVSEPDMGLLDLKRGEFSSKVGFGNTKVWGWLVTDIKNKIRRL